MSIEKEFHFEDPFMSPPVIRPSPRLHSSPMLLPYIAALLPRATFHALIVPQACRMEPSGDISCFYCSPSVSYGTLGRHFIPLSFLKGIARHSRGTFHVKIVSQACRVTPSGDIPCPNCSPRVSCDTLRRRFMPLSFPKRAVRNP